VRELRRRVQERLVYPWLAVRRGLTGTVELEIELDAAGRVVALAAVGPEAPRLLRDAALKAVRDAAPFPLPPGVAPRALAVRLPVVFELR
jgi:protein TonB